MVNTNYNPAVPMVSNTEVVPTQPQTIGFTLQQIGYEAKWFAKLPITTINVNPDYVKSGTHYDELDALAESISAAGAVFQPVFVCKDGDRYFLVDGHKRLIAAYSVGHESIPAIILPGNVKNYGALGLIMDKEWHKLCHLKMALGLKMVDIPGELVAKFVGMSKSSISELQGLCRIPDDIAMEIIRKGDFSKRTLIQLSRAGSEDEIRLAYEHYKEHGKLPERPMRAYTSSKKNKHVLSQLEKTNRVIGNIPNAEFSPPDFVQNIRKAFGTLNQSLVCKGFLEQFDAPISGLPNPDQFAASNFTRSLSD